MSVSDPAREDDLRGKEGCLVCGCRDRCNLYDLQQVSGITHQVVRCHSCGLVFLDPLPKDEEIEARYLDPNYPLSAYFKHMAAGYEHRAEVEPYQKGLELAECLLGGQGRVLDIGCSTGVFLDLARKRGWETVGVEISPHFVAYARSTFGLEVYQGRLRDQNFKLESFDLITMWDFLEHVRDPLWYLKEAYRLLREGGLVLVLTPNEHSLLKKTTFLSHRATLGRWGYAVGVVYDLHHLYYFSDRTLKELLARAGLKVLHIRKEETYLERIIGRDSDHWIKKNQPVVWGLRAIFFLARLTRTQNKILVLSRKDSLTSHL
jgi:SAM-dependent methyltransferase